MQYLIPDRYFQFLKWLALIVLPAVATFTGTVGMAAGWEGTGLAVTILVAFGTLLGTTLGVSAATAKPHEIKTYDPNQGGSNE